MGEGGGGGVWYVGAEGGVGVGLGLFKPWFFT